MRTAAGFPGQGDKNSCENVSVICYNKFDNRIEKKDGIAMKKLLVLLAALLLCVGGAHAEITAAAQLNASGVTVGVDQGSAAELTVRELLPHASMAYFTDKFMGYTAVAQGKIDAFVYDRRQMQLAIEGGQAGVHLLDDTLGDTVKVAVGLSPVSKIPDLEGKINQFIAALRADGTLDDMYRRWVSDGNEAMPKITLPGSPSLHLTVGTSGIVPPYSYYQDGKLNGYDIELAYRFAAWLGADVEFKVYDYGAIIPAALTGDVDCVMANLNLTPERQEAMTFSDILYESELGILVRGETAAAEPAPAWAAYNGKRLGVLTGPLMEDIAHANFPDSEYMLFNSYPDCITALMSGRIDAYLGDEPGLKSVHAEQPRIDYIRERITNQEYSFAFRKNDPESARLCEELNAFLAQSHADGTMQELDDIWFGVDEGRKVVDMSGLTGENGTIRVVTTSTDMPWSYIKDGKNVGYDIDLVVRFCRAAGYKLELGDVDFAARIPAIQSGKYDFTTDMNVTEERKEQVLFSDPTSTGGVVLAILTDGTEPKAAQEAPADPLSPLAWNGKRMGILTGTSFEAPTLAFFPDSEYLYYNSYTDVTAALANNKIDGFLGDEPALRILAGEVPEVTYLSEKLVSDEYAFGFGKSGARADTIRGQFNEMLAEIMADGTLDALNEKWFGDDEAAKVVDLKNGFSGENGKLNVATTATDVPFSYVKDNEYVGLSIELVELFCRRYGYTPVVENVDFAARIPGLVSGKYDMCASSMAITEERKESISFSDPFYQGGIVLAVRKGDAPAETAESAGASHGEAARALAALNGRRIGVQTGTSFDKSVAALFPDAQIEYYNSKPDMINALQTRKIDAYAVDEPVAKAQMQQNDKLTYIPEYMEHFDFAYVFPKTQAGQALCDQFSEYLATIRADGTLAEIEAKWFSEDESVKTLADYAAFPAVNGTLNMATEAMYEPFSYVKGNEIVGYDIDVAVGFCQAYGYGLKITDMNFDAVLPAVQSGKCDFGGAGITITEERKESVLFSAPNFSGGTVMTVLKADAQPAAQTPAAAPSGLSVFWEDIQASFSKTFLRENRWQLFLEGVGNTMLITVLAILFGTALGFLVFMLCRNGNPAANGVSRFSMWLVQGMPMVVLLMILYYIVFGRVAISGIAVAVIGFTLTFGSAVFGMLKMGVGSVDRGQYEAAYALGHSNRHTFFRIILPQAIPLVLPAFQGEIVGLIKATAIVGYIAVQDLTKMGDIVRSRTYEAFFPLIAITVIYFMLEGLLSFAVSRIRIDPKKRKRENILKGVNLHD